MKRTDDKIEEAVEAGRRNAEAMALMRNWCAHARTRRMGGVGMVEQMTGLPISHFAMECDHAPGGGMACWDFGESALDFYDRNCVSCAVRQPVGLPNLGRLVAERDEARRAADARQRIELDRAERALQERRRSREELRPSLDAVNQALLDDLDAFDRDHADADRTRLAEAARMAPERIDPRVVDLLFTQAGATTSLALVTLDVGAHVAKGERRLLLLAQRLFRAGLGGEAAAQVLLDNLAHLPDADITELVPAAAELASPDHHDYFGGSELPCDPRLLVALWFGRPESVRRGIDGLLDRLTVATSQLAGRAMRIILENDRGAAQGFVRSAASRYVRAKQLLPELGEYESLGDMAGALDILLDEEPGALDAVLQELLVGASIEAKRGVASIYGQALRGRYADGKDLPVPETRLRLGLARLTWLPSQILDQQVLSTVADALRHPPDEIWQLVEDRADDLVGAALLLDEQVAAGDAALKKDASMLEHIERNTFRSAAYGVVSRFLKLAAQGSRTEAARRRFIQTVQAIPEERALLRGLAHKAAMRMAGDIAGLNAVLPLLYAGLVGTSVQGRAQAALSLSEIPSRGRQDIPALVYEAFCALLLDQYVAVHKNAVSTIQRISIPDDFKPRVGYALFQLVSAYSGSDKDDNFLVDCIEELARLANRLPDPASVREFCCHAALKAEPLFVRSGARSLRYSLKASDDFALVVAHVLPQYADNMNQRDEEEELIQAMSSASVLKHKARLVAVAEKLADESMWLSTLIADALYRAGAHAEATGILKKMSISFGATMKDQGRALFVTFPLLAYGMEQALATGDASRWRELADEWDARLRDQQTFLEDRRARDSRSRFSFPG